jgi:pilus assembly protein Flp/PilA
VRALIKRILWNSRGASAAEYALIIAVVGSAIAVAAIVLGSTVSNSMNTSSQTIADCGGSC